MRPWAAAAALAVLAGLVVPGLPADAEVPVFTDVPPGYWAEDEINWAVDAGYVTPLTPTRFGPQRPMTRGHAVRMLWRVSGSPTGQPEHGLTDVPTSMEAAVRWSVAEGIATGFRDDTFRPTATVSRAQLASWLWVLDGSPTGDPSTGLTDVDGRWSTTAVRWAVAERIASGYRGTRRFDGASGVRRDQAVAWLAAWAAPRLPRVTVTASLSDTNAVTVSWEVRNALHTLAPELDVEPLVGRRATHCEDGLGCSATVRTGQPGINRFLVTARNTAGGLTQASTELDVPRPSMPAVTVRHEAIDPFAAPAEPQVLAWTRPPGVPAEAPIASDYVKVRRADSIFSLPEELPLDGTFPLTGDRRATTEPVGWAIQYCREPEADEAALCGNWALTTFDPRPALFDAPFRRFESVGEDVEVTWSGVGDRWVVDAPTLGVTDEEVTSPTFTFPGPSVVEGAHPVTVRACDDACDGTASENVRDRMQIVVGMDLERPHWDERSLADDFTVERFDTRARRSTGVPLDVAFGSGNRLWSIGEFGRDLAVVRSGTVAQLETPYARRQTTDADDVVQRELVRPFGNPLGRCVGRSSESSAFGERVIWSGEHVWFTQGGAFGDPCAVANHSRLVRYDPAARDDPHTEGDDRFCAVHVPGTDNNVVGIAHDPVADRIWFTELDIIPDQGRGQLGWFDEDEVGCDNALDYEDPAAVQLAADAHACGPEAVPGCVHLIPLAVPTASPPTASHPTHLDIGDGYVWVADYGGAVLSRYPLGGGEIEQFPLPTATATWSTVGSFDWQIRVTGDAVYLIEYADNQILRFATTAPDLAAACGALVDGRNPCVDEVFLPVGASTVNAHSIALEGNHLWFTLANEAADVRDPGDAAFGFLDLATWDDDDAPDGVIYTDLDDLPATGERDHRSPRGIDVAADGRVVLSELDRELVLLTPT